MLSLRDRQRKLSLRRQTLRMRHLSSQLSQSSDYAPPKPTAMEVRWTRDGPVTLEENARRVMALHDQLPERIRGKAKERQDFDIERDFARGMAAMATIKHDIEDA
mgnify:CR=1 FL=1